MIEFLVGPYRLVRVGLGQFEVHVGERWHGTISRDEDDVLPCWSFTTRPLGPPIGSATGTGYLTAQEAAAACAAASVS